MKIICTRKEMKELIQASKEIHDHTVYVDEHESAYWDGEKEPLPMGLYSFNANDHLGMNILMHLYNSKDIFEIEEKCVVNPDKATQALMDIKKIIDRAV